MKLRWDYVREMGSMIGIKVWEVQYTEDSMENLFTAEMKGTDAPGSGIVIVTAEVAPPVPNPGCILPNNADKGTCVLLALLFRSSFSYFHLVTAHLQACSLPGLSSAACCWLLLQLSHRLQPYH